MPNPNLLLLDDDPGVLALLARVAGAAGFSVSTFEDPRAALAAARQHPPDAALVDVRLPGSDGIAVLQELRQYAPDCDVLLMSGYGSIESAVDALKLGARDYLCKPFDMGRLVATLNALCHKVEVRVRVGSAPDTPAEVFEGMVGTSAVMADLFELVRRVAPHFTTALVSGETGTGKELVARALHRLGRRRDRPFVTVNCSARSSRPCSRASCSVTSAARSPAPSTRAPGLFERADGGTLFLDEIGELPLERCRRSCCGCSRPARSRRSGRATSRHVDVHVIAATNRELDEEVAAGRFRADLFYRLNVVELRRAAAAGAQGRRAAHRGGHRARLRPPVRARHPRPRAGGVRAAAVWSWPGNVRELRNTLERACMLAQGAVITPRDLRLGTRTPSVVAASAPEVAAVRPIAEIEREEIERALLETRGNKKEAARRLGISRRALYRRLEKFDLHHPDHHGVAA